jgi:hypothetical protein
MGIMAIGVVLLSTVVGKHPYQHMEFTMTGLLCVAAAVQSHLAKL